MALEQPLSRTRFNADEHTAIRAQLQSNGFAVVRGVVDPSTCRDIAKATAGQLDVLKPNWKTEGIPGTFGSAILNWGKLAAQSQMWDVRVLFAEFMAELMEWEQVCTSFDNIKLAVAGRKPPKASSLKPHIDMSKRSPEHELYLKTGGYTTIQGQVCITNPGKVKFCYGDLINVDDLPDNNKKGFTPIPGATCPFDIILEAGETLLWTSNLVHTNCPNYEAYDPDAHEFGLRTLGVFVCCANKEWQTDKERAAKIARIEKGLTGTHNPIGIKPNGGNLHMSVSRNPEHKHYVKQALEVPSLKRKWIEIM